jgi:tetratricopeptide (TPR) repeat protein
LAALGRADEARADADEAYAIASALGHRGWTATALRAMGIAAQAAGDVDAALHAFERSLAASQHLDLFASWAAARTALVLISIGELERAEPLVAHALTVGPPLGHYEGRLAQVELAAARNDRGTTTLARAAIELATTGGVAQGVARLRDLATG